MAAEPWLLLMGEPQIHRKTDVTTVCWQQAGRVPTPDLKDLAMNIKALTSARRAGPTAACTVLAAALSLLSSGPAAAASGTDSFTQHQHGSWVETDDEDFCTGELIPEVDVTGNSVFHIRNAASGAVSYTMAEEGSLSFLEDGLTYSGRLVFSGSYV
ncbi:MAG: hypothetical protein JWO12_3392, partial [Frankiales bacterium]|nr:hypothetical protein [Frankiales bacterium]